MRFLPLTILLLAPGLLSAVEHSGTVRAADQFIPGATVTAKQGGAKLVTYTDENGRYSFDLTPGVWDIEISMFGFKTLTTPITIKDQFTSRDWTLEMPRPGEVVEPPKPTTTTETKKPDTPATTTAAATPTPTPATPAKPTTPAPAANGGGRTGRGNGQQQASAQAQGRGGRGRGQTAQTNQPAFQSADVTATDAGQQALANASTADLPDIANADTSDAFTMNGSTSGGLGMAADEQQARMAMAGRGGRGGGGPGGFGGPGGGLGLGTLGASLGGPGGDPLGMGGFGAAGADAGFGADAGGGGFGLGGGAGAGGGGGGRGGGGAGGGGGGGGRGGGGGGGRGGGGAGGRGAAGGRGGRGPFNGQFASIGNRRGRGRQQSPYSGSVSINATNSALNAAPFSLNGQSQPKPSSAREQITGNFGGPLRIPKLYNVPNPKWQFYLNFSALQARNGSSQVSEVPTLAERDGDFSNAVVKQSVNGVATYVPTVIYDPLSGAPFPGNVIPNYRINSTAQSLMQYIPLPLYSNIVQNYAISPSNPSHTESFAVRLNGRINNKNTMNFNQQFSFNGSNSLETGIVDGSLPIKDTTSGYGMSSTVGWTHIFKPRLNNNASVTFSRNIRRTDPFFANRTNVTGDLGIVGPDQSPEAWGPPTLGFTNFGRVADGDFSSSRSQTTSFTDTVTYVYKRSHNLSFGLGYRRMQNNQLSFANSGGSLTFNGLLTAGYDSTGKALANTGYDFADFLLGYPQSSTLRVNDSNLYYRGWAANIYAQDDWRVKPGLTVNVGLRWEYFSPYTELHGQMATLDINSAMTLACPVGAAAVATNVSPAAGCPPASVLNGPFSGRYPTSLVKSDPREFSPRLGFNWRPNPKHSLLIGGGYSVFYSGAAYSAMAARLAGQPQFSTTANLTNSVSLVQGGDGLTLQCAFILAPQCPNTPVPAAGVVTNTYAINKNYLPAYAQNWTMTVQHELPHNLVMSLEYVGIKGTRLDVVENPNQLPPNCTTCGKGLVSNANGFIYETDTGNSIYNAGQVRFTRRMTRGISTQLLYTYSKAIDDASGFTGGGSGSVVQNIFDLRGERGLSSTDQRNRLTISSVLSSPVGIHGMFRNGGWKTKAFTGWTLQPTFTIASGAPKTAMLGGALGASKISGVAANYRAEATGTSISGGGYPYFNENAFTNIIPTGQYGNAGVDTIPGIASFSLNAALNRTWRFGESRKNLQVRLSANNALNHVQITGFGTTFGSSNFGLATGASGTRTVSLMTRFSF